ncbi:MAG: STAS domain-containing protein [Sedimentisphaerales bacterium]|jgi:anti-anti-sigma factor
MKAHTGSPLVVRVAPIVHATEQLKNLIAEEVDSDVVLDVSDLGFATSMLLNELLELRASVLGRGHRIIICCIDERVRGILGVTGLDDVFMIAATQEEALAALNEADQAQTDDSPHK